MAKGVNQLGRSEPNRPGTFQQGRPARKSQVCCKADLRRSVRPVPVANRTEHVVYHGTVAWSRFGGFDPDILLKLRIEIKVLIRDDAFRRHGKRRRHLKYDIRLAHLPLLVKLDWLGQVRFIAKWHTIGDPVVENFLLVGG